MQKYLTKVKIFQKVLGGYFFNNPVQLPGLTRGYSIPDCRRQGTKQSFFMKFTGKSQNIKEK